MISPKRLAKRCYSTFNLSFYFLHFTILSRKIENGAVNPPLMHYRRKKNLVRARGFESVGSKKEVSVHAVKYYDPCLLVYSV